MELDMKQLAYCGIYCEQCSFKVAAETQERKHLLNMPQRYDVHKQQVLSELFCPGCKGEAICGDCEIKTCAEHKGLDSCADCEVFSCKVLLDFANDGVPHHKWALENLQAIRAKGAEAWFEQLKPALNCDCGERQSWYYECSACGVAKATN